MDKMNQLIGYPRELDGAVLPARDYPLCPESATDRALSVKMTGCWSCWFYAMELDSVCVS